MFNANAGTPPSTWHNLVTVLIEGKNHGRVKENSANKSELRTSLIFEDRISKASSLCIASPGPPGEARRQVDIPQSSSESARSAWQLEEHKA